MMTAIRTATSLFRNEAPVFEREGLFSVDTVFSF